MVGYVNCILLIDEKIKCPKKLFKSLLSTSLYRVCSFNPMLILFLFLKGLFGYINCILLIDEKIKCQTVQTSLYTFTDEFIFVVSLNPQNRMLRIKDSSS